MSILRSRAELDRKPRTVQFLVERVCPIEHPNGISNKTRAMLPAEIWVHAIPEKPNYLDCPECDGRHYRVLPESVEMIRGERSHMRFVCEHAGKLIE